MHEKIHDKFLAGLESAKKLRQGQALSSSVDCGAVCMRNKRSTFSLSSMTP